MPESDTSFLFGYTLDDDCGGNAHDPPRLNPGQSPLTWVLILTAFLVPACLGLALPALGQAPPERPAPDIPIAALNEERAPTEEEKEVIAEEARAREQSAENDPLSTRQAEKTAEKLEEKAARADQPATPKVADVTPLPEKRWSFSWYASPRLRYQVTGDETAFSDDVSRAGFSTAWTITSRYEVFASLEAGFDVFNTLSYWTNPDGQPPENKDDDPVFDRLHYIGLDAPDLLVLWGKNWSPYYSVAGFTDRFDGAGGEASGIYNAGTDGGSTGTGRADRATQVRWHIDFLPSFVGLKPFNLNLQYQGGESIPRVPDAHYTWSGAASAIIEHSNELSFGIAFNQANVDDDDLPRLEQFGITDDARTMLIGAKWFGEKSYISTTYARSSNHETTDKNIYFDANGWEVYAQRQIYNKIWAVGGWNFLTPRGDQEQAGEFEVKLGILGARYLLDDFNRMFYVEYQLRNGNRHDGRGRGDIFTIGMRWDFPANKK